MHVFSRRGNQTDSLSKELSDSAGSGKQINLTGEQQSHESDCKMCRVKRKNARKRRIEIRIKLDLLKIMKTI